MKTRVFYSILMIQILMLSLIAQSQFSTAQISELQLPQEHEEPLFVESLKGANLTWKIDQNLGVFFILNYLHTEDLIQLGIFDVNATEGFIKFTIEMTSYLARNYDLNYLTSLIYGYSPLLVPRHWGIVAATEILFFAPVWMFHPDILASYFGQESTSMTGQELLDAILTNDTFRDTVNFETLYQYAISILLNQYLTIEYDTIWWNFRMLTVVRINIDITEDNFIHLLYTRSEGILLSNEISLQITPSVERLSEFSGKFALTLDKVDGYELKVSPWHYVLWTGVTVVSLLILIVIISIVINRRQRRLLDTDY